MRSAPVSGSRKLNDHAIGRDRIDLKPLRGEPFFNGGDILGCRANSAPICALVSHLWKLADLGLWSSAISWSNAASFSGDR